MSAPESKTIVLENTSRRDALIEIEKKYQKIWQDEKVFEVDAPTFEEEPYGIDSDELHRRRPKHFSSMAYPYMNGVLHAGHGFTLSKVEFANGFERMTGKKSLFPLGFHCTGMPISAAADKLAREIEQFGEDFSRFPADAEEEEEPAPKEVKQRDDLSKFSAKKSKVVAKQGRSKFQFEILQQLGIPDEEIPKFADPYYWLTYFPPLCQNDVTSFGARVDWRRSMITTDLNPYYDAFVRWQMNKLKEDGKIKFGKRYTIYSEKDGQPCMDHDRQSGEGVTPQEYTCIKIKITEFAPEAQGYLKQKNFDFASNEIFLVAATLRPETMYGQTCCFVSKKIDYGIFEAAQGQFYICTERAFKNMSFQGLTPQRGYYKPVVQINGSVLIGSKITAPLAAEKELRILPMDTILPNKGTGVVTCVPSDSPDDYINTRDLAHKSEYYGIKKEWVIEDFVALIRTEKYGDKCAEYLVNELKIKSPKDAVQLAKAKELAYKEGFYNGIMIYGKFTGEKVENAKRLVRDQMLEENTAFVYNEPEGVVMSRSGDECVVSLEDQWYLDYGEESWKALALECLDNMNLFSPETEHAFEGVLNWLKNWAVSRTYGLGTRIPWDKKYLVESLSDSTVYHSFYTFCHLLHSDYYGKEVGPLGITADQMTDDVFDYIFCRTEEIKSDIPAENLKKLRREFEYFYPLDISISGKDLIPNHLTFCIYVHTALFPKRFWPKGIRANGHLMLNNAKMSKSTGNFMTLHQIVEKFGADAARIALADAGDTTEDANLDESNANAAILRLFTFKEWAEEIVKNADSLRSGPIEKFFDVAFENEMNRLIEETYEQYSLTNFKSALKYGLFDYQTARDYYRESVGAGNMHRDLVLRYIETQVLMLAPVAPHFAEYIYREVLQNKGSVQFAAFPRASKPVAVSVTSALEYVKDLQRSIREVEGAGLKKKKGKQELDPSKPVKVTLYVASTFPEWQTQFIELVREAFEQQTLDDTKSLREKIEPKEIKRAMPFISILKQRLQQESPEVVFNREASFNEEETIKSVLHNLKRSPAILKVEQFQVISFKPGSKIGKDIETGGDIEITATGKVVDSAVPGEPGISIKNL
ncbi:leucyl tRNA synthetase, cytoplasmic [Komagataella phaffii CBS 7435]|uniref:leucine--tRNA ligase n=2 Tax=Komagataella phaffii TaxID=460519 RepID=C4R7R8_KOMPG|nr:Cytosolic leucyl tRNA synthetase, ligates leucine to the appropriate tRNA [Komagataella phaffii GS115]AOA64589.1 GQ67_04743T0 [Komagataella phaffii]CAH2450975.1 leucyl tRNA synthetase, cytoplasmic [Komagataella phaffii CBS 7435]AOA69702.1 GQ68_04715T0 [Komagataella phaffii GS115]CAY71643.1 Cytosolic leucyl tRNA synthetase, ligates leucine to the appropriate tRNA [Komagataella phaffii GS115]CCA40754.1 leucyl tRNA synthetase, cytoplasmic [Komagataella phaffii CBS 7435]